MGIRVESANTEYLITMCGIIGEQFFCGHIIIFRSEIILHNILLHLGKCVIEAQEFHYLTCEAIIISTNTIVNVGVES